MKRKMISPGEPHPWTVGTQSTIRVGQVELILHEAGEMRGFCPHGWVRRFRFLFRKVKW